MYLLCVCVCCFGKSTHAHAHRHLFDVQFSNYIISTLSFYGSFWLLLVFFFVQFISLNLFHLLSSSLSIYLLSGTHVVCVNVGCCKSLDLIRNYTQDRQFFAGFFPARFRNWNVVYVFVRIFTHSLTLSIYLRWLDANENFSTHNTFPMLMENRRNAYIRIHIHVDLDTQTTYIYPICAKSAVLKMHFMPSLTRVTHERKSKFNIPPLCVYKRFEHKFIHLL